MNNGDTPANPVTEYCIDGTINMENLGLTKREVFAMHALHGLLANGKNMIGTVSYAVSLADELLKKLEE